MITEDNMAVLIDFDSCLSQEEPLEGKHGTEGWSDNSAKLSKPGNDIYSFQKVKDFVVRRIST